MLSSSKTFFAVFFGVILISIFLIYNAIYIKHSYRQYTSEDEVPTFPEMYLDLRETVISKFYK